MSLHRVTRLITTLILFLPILAEGKVKKVVCIVPDTERVIYAEVKEEDSKYYLIYSKKGNYYLVNKAFCNVRK